MKKLVTLTQIGGKKLSPREIGKEEARMVKHFRDFGLRRLYEEKLLNSAGVREFHRLDAGPLSTSQKAKGADLPLFVSADRCAGGTS